MSDQCLPPDPCQSFAPSDPMECCEILRGRLEQLQTELRTLRALVAGNAQLSQYDIPGPFATPEIAEAGGVEEWQIYLGEDGQLFTLEPIP